MLQSVESLKCILGKYYDILVLDKSPLNSINYKFENVFYRFLNLDDVDAVESIIKKYADENYNPMDSECISPFHLACYFNFTNHVDTFLKCGNYVNCCISNNVSNFSRYSPLHLAIENNNKKVIEILLNNGADVSLKNGNAESPLYFAYNRSEKPCKLIRDLLIISNCKKNLIAVEDEGFSLIYSIFLEHNEYYKLHYSDTSWTSWTPLHFATALEITELIEYLIINKANVNAVDNSGMTPLHLICLFNFSTYYFFNKEVNLNADCNMPQNKIAKLLLSYNGNINAKDKYGKTPLFCAIESFETVKAIDLNVHSDRFFMTNYRTLIDILLEYNADTTISDNQGFTVLHTLSSTSESSSEDNKIRIVKDILNKGANINAETRAKITPLFLSIRSQYLHLSKFFIESGANVNGICYIHRQFTAIHAITYYCKYNRESVKILKMLLEKGADPSSKEIGGATALHIAIDNHRSIGLGHILDEEDQMVLALLKHGAVVDAQDINGETPLHRACMHNYIPGVTPLLNHGADINIKDDLENTPVNCIRYGQTEENVKFFSIIKRHVCRLQFLGHFVDEKINSVIAEFDRLYKRISNSHLLLTDFRFMCDKETLHMKSKKLNNNKTLFDVLVTNVNNLIPLLENEVFLKIINSENFDEHFQMYGYLIRLKYKRGVKRLKLIKAAEQTLKSIIKFELPHLCSSIIFSYLSDNDLDYFVESFK